MATNSPLVLTDTARPGYWLFGDHATFVATGENTGGQFSLFDFYTLPQGGPLPHIHHRETEFAYILDGEVSYQMHDEVFTAKAGSFVYKPKDHLHAFTNLGTTPTRHLEFVLPSGLENLFSAIGQLAPTTSPPPPQLPPANLLDTNFALLAQYGVEAPDSLYFAPSEYNFPKTGTPTVTVFRPGKADEDVSVTINADDGVTQSSIQVNFAKGERIKTVPITAQSLADGNSIEVTLDNPTGGAELGMLQNKAVLTSLDDNSYVITNGNKPEDFQSLLPNPNPVSYWLGGENYKFIATGADTDGLLSMFDVLVPPQTASEPLLSAPVDQAYFILDGNVTFQLDDQVVTATPNTFVLLPKDNPYALTNLGNTPTRAILFNPHSGLEDFLKAHGSPVSVTESSPVVGLLMVLVLGILSLVKSKYLSGNNKVNFSPKDEEADLF